MGTKTAILKKLSFVVTGDRSTVSVPMVLRSGGAYSALPDLLADLQRPHCGRGGRGEERSEGVGTKAGVSPDLKMWGGQLPSI